MMASGRKSRRLPPSVTKFQCRDKPPNIRSDTVDEFANRSEAAVLRESGSCAVAWDFIDANPVKQFSKRHIKESPPRTTYPTAKQVDRLVANTAPMTGRIIRLLAEAGMRQEEVCGLEWSRCPSSVERSG